MQAPAFLNGLKTSVKRLRRSARTAYVNRFHAFTPDDFCRSLNDLGVQSGDVLCVHSSFESFQGFQGKVGDALRSLQESVGADGGIIMPTQPFSCTAVEYARRHPVTDLVRAPSLMGFMSEILRRSPGTRRSINPTHPVVAWGSRGLSLLGNDWEAGTPCGRNTAYHRLLERNGKILMLGTGLQPMTFYHCVEELIEPLMPVSPFTEEVFALRTRDATGTVHESRMRLFEPDLSARRRMSLLVPELQARGWWTEGSVGRLSLILLSTANVLNACRSMAEKGQFCYLSARHGDDESRGD
jgi:aminoglycoside N3'-acetyltransferase